MRDREWEHLFLDLLFFYYENQNQLYLSLPDGHQLYSWTEEQKNLFLNNKLTDYQLFLLNLIKFQFYEGQAECDDVWLIHFYELLQFYKEHNNLNVPKDYQTETNINLHAWLHMQKRKQKEGKLKPFQIKKLENLNIQWIKKKTKKAPEWDMMYVEAEKFFDKHQHLLISRNFVTKDGVQLGKWVCEQRDCYIGIGRRKLKPDEIKKLEKIGMYWGSLEDGRWEFFISKLRSYASENAFPMNEDEVYDGFTLAKQLRFYLSKQDKDKMRELNRIKPKNLNWFK